MSETVVTGNEFLDLLPITPRVHLREQTPESSPPNSTPPAGAAHMGASPEDGAKGAV